MNKCPNCRSQLELLNLMQVCPTCGFYRMIGKAKSRNKVLNWSTWANYVLNKEKDA